MPLFLNKGSESIQEVYTVAEKLLNTVKLHNINKLQHIFNLYFLIYNVCYNLFDLAEGHFHTTEEKLPKWYDRVTNVKPNTW